MTQLSPLEEQQALIPIQNEARHRLAAAVRGERRTSRMPPGYIDRDAAVEELRYAEAVAAEMGV